MTTPAAAPEFSRLIAVEGIAIDKLRTETVTATPEECAALATRFDLRGLANFSAVFNIRRVLGGKTIRIEGKLSADVMQACVVSLQDVPSHVTAEFQAFFTEDPLPPENDVEFAYDDDESMPEAIDNGIIDLGEMAAQYLSLELDPYPRAPGVSLAAQAALTGVTIKENPFQILEKLKKEDKK